MRFILLRHTVIYPPKDDITRFLFMKSGSCTVLFCWYPERYQCQCSNHEIYGQNSSVGLPNDNELRHVCITLEIYCSLECNYKYHHAYMHTCRYTGNGIGIPTNYLCAVQWYGLISCFLYGWLQFDNLVFNDSGSVSLTVYGVCFTIVAFIYTEIMK